MTIKYLDDKGKAIYGVPGPGAYETPSTMTNTARGARSGSPLRPESAPAGKGKFSLLLTAKLTGACLGVAGRAAVMLGGKGGLCCAFGMVVALGACHSRCLACYTAFPGLLRG